MNHDLLMQPAIDACLVAYQQMEVPVGAAIYLNGDLISTGYNQKETLHSATAHAEILAINTACKVIGDWRLAGATLYVTAEPCFMCAGAIIQARISEVVFGVAEPKFGGVVTHANLFDMPKLNHRVKYMGGVREAEIREIMQQFFRELR
ncbi:MAG: nucleoside deaminase [Deferribacteraceae bacterium]|jgi:tRNA(adenine34) deaminase|nr:nucleoside deaminase [Deferribacteraceae bacterium]